MRAETQAHVDAIQKSLALLAQRMDWETAPHRLEEFNALIEQPDPMAPLGAKGVGASGSR